MHHIIKKQVFDLQLDKKLDSFYIQQLISNQYWTWVVPAMEKEFDKAGYTDGNTGIEKIVVDLGVISVNRLEKKEWISAFHTTLKKQLEELKSSSFSGADVVHKSTSPGMFRQWLFYMQHGYLAWNTISADDNWYREVSDAIAREPTGARDLRIAMINDPLIIRRIIWQHADWFLISLVDALAIRQPVEIQKIIHALEDIPEYQKQGNGPDQAGVREFRNSLWNLILRKAANGSPVTLQEAGELVQDYVQSRKLPPSFLEKTAVGKILIEEPAERNETGTEKAIQALDLAVLSETGIGEEGIYVVNAGLVLLHPFLNNFFIRLKLVEQEKFADPDSHRRALFLLHYLATGKSAAGEHELVMEKILCSFPLNEPVEAEIVLTKEEIEEAGDMLAAVIVQWEILKNTSVDGLREGFLQRRGKLFTRQDNLYLQVEAGSIDILLDHLPWNLSMIRLPWMEGVLRVEWR